MTALLIAGLVALAGLYQLVSLIAALRQIARREHPPGFTPPVSILKPVRGRDPRFYEAIRSHAAQDYPEFEILFGVNDAEDAAIEDIRRLQAEFPNRPIHLIVSETRFPNRKVGVMADLAARARHPYLLVSDSDIRVDAGYIARVVAPLQSDDTGISTCLYRASAEGLAGRWEALGIATDFAPSVLVAPLVGVREFGLGATLVFRAADLARIGGFAALADFLADDYQLARRITGLGKRAVLAKTVVETCLGDPTWAGVWRHQVRWARTIRVSRGGGYLGLPITHAGLWIALCAAAGLWWPAAALALVRMAAGLATGWGVLRSPVALAGWPLIPLWDLWAFAVWCAGLAGRTVEWRGIRLRLTRDGKIVPGGGEDLQMTSEISAEGRETVALHDQILRDIMTGRVPWRFQTRDLKRIPGTTPGRFRVGTGEYAENTINTVPRNHSVRPDGTEPGDYVRKGRNPAFLWHGKGEYELLLDHQHVLEDVSPEDEQFDVTEGEGETLILGSCGGIGSCPLAMRVDDELVLRIAKQGQADPAAIIVRYIAEKPFQAHYRRKPVGLEKHGWGQRLAAYCWPMPDRSWQTTCSTTRRLSSQIQQAIRKLEVQAGDRVAAGELLDAFKDICVWGGVRLPESDSGVLADEVLCVCRVLSQGKVPPAWCRLNSAWTKLYAFARPDDCVIYDSRVAAALTSILDPAMEFPSRCDKWLSYAKLGTVPGRGGSRPRTTQWDWPRGYGVWESQTAANLLCRDVLEELNRQATTQPDCRKLNGPSPWTLREVEAVLFMEGY